MPKKKMPKQLREFRISFEHIPPGKSMFEERSDALGFRSKLGGKPQWDQGDETPDCPSCRKLMRFIGQIDSIEHNVSQNPHRQDFSDQEYMFGDVGMIYVFFCYDCLQTQSVFQCG